MGALVLPSICWQEPGEAWGFEPLSIWLDRDEQLAEFRRLLAAHPEVPLALRGLRLRVPTLDLRSLEDFPETAWVGDAESLQLTFSGLYR